MERQGPTHPKVKDNFPKSGNLAGGTRQFEKDGVDEWVAEGMLVKRMLAERSLIDEPGDRKVDADRKLDRTTRGEDRRTNSSIKASTWHGDEAGQ